MDDYKCEYGRFAGEPVERLFFKIINQCVKFRNSCKSEKQSEKQICHAF